MDSQYQVVPIVRVPSQGKAARGSDYKICTQIIIKVFLTGLRLRVTPAHGKPRGSPPRLYHLPRIAVRVRGIHFEFQSFPPFLLINRGLRGAIITLSLCETFRDSLASAKLSEPKSKYFSEAQVEHSRLVLSVSPLV